MISPQNHEHGIGDVMRNSQEQWYAAVDECLLVSEVHPTSYEYTVEQAIPTFHLSMMVG